MRSCHAKVSKSGSYRLRGKRYPISSKRFENDAQPSNLGEMVVDEAGTICYCNSFAANLFGSSSQLLVGLQIAGLIRDISLNSQGREYEAGSNQYLTATGYWQVFQGLTAEGNRLPLEIHVNKQGTNGEYFILLRTSHIQRQRRHSDPLIHLQQISETSKLAVMIATAKSKVTYVNPAFEALTGYCCQELVGQNASIFNAGAHDQRLFEYDCLWTALSEGKDGQQAKEFPFCFVNRRKDGEFFFMEQIIRPFVASDGTVTHYIFTGRDISERVMNIRQLLQQANYDDLTGLTNRGLFLDRMRHAFSQAARRKDHFALLYVDLDGLKSINDTYGHAAGDALLRTAALRLRQSVRVGDTVARLGGDEFALILSDAKIREDVQKIVEKIFQVFQEGFVFENKQLIIRASIGACIYPENGENCDQLIQRADKAMYKQKIAGGNGLCFFGG